MRGWVVAAVLVLAAACARRPETPLFTGEPYLLVWAGDADRQNADFLAVLDADPTSPSYGKVLKTYPVRSRGNEPQALNAVPRADRRVFASGLLTSRTFVFDVRQPLGARLVHVDEPSPTRRFWVPHEYVTLANGHVLVTCPDPARYRGDPRELLGSPGGLVELDADGGFVRELPAADPAARHLIIAPYAIAAAPSIARLVTTNAGHGYAATARVERMPGISVQVWKLDDLTLLRTVILDAGPRGEENLGPIAARFLHRKPFLFVSTDQGGGLYASDSVNTPSPAFQLVFDFGAGALGGEIAITPDDRFLVEALAGTSRVVSLDLADPWHPKLVSTVRLDRDPLDASKARRGGPHALAMSADGTRIAVADYTVDVPGLTQDGDHRVYVLRLDPNSGRLRIDGAFQDERTGEVGVTFERASWPHGETGPARPAGLLFVTPEPPPAKGRGG
jgi:selenium binding protein SBP56